MDPKGSRTRPRNEHAALILQRPTHNDDSSSNFPLPTFSGLWVLGMWKTSKFQACCCLISAELLTYHIDSHSQMPAPHVPPRLSQYDSCVHLPYWINTENEHKTEELELNDRRSCPPLLALARRLYDMRLQNLHAIWTNKCQHLKIDVT